MSRSPHRDTVLLLADALALEGEERDRFLAAARRLSAGGPVLAPMAAQSDRLLGFLDEPTPFIGREDEIAAVSNLLLEPNVRLLTLTGPGGTGKTRLALRVARALRESFPAGVAFVSLASIIDPAHIPSAIASVLGVAERGDQPIEQLLTLWLREKHMLLVLDNLEHLLSGATFLAELLDACPLLTILVTSRTVLHLAREYDWEVRPLSLPDRVDGQTVEELTDAEAVRLFVERAGAARAGFTLTDENAVPVAAICRRLDGLPLAIELAAARIRLFPPQTLLVRLAPALQLLTAGPRDAPERQQTLRNAIDWSFDLLNSTEQQLFARLAVFAGGCSLPAVETVCGEAGSSEALDGLASLVEQSLIRQEEGVAGEGRYRMLETIREYAQERLENLGEGEELRRRHAAYFLRLAEQLEPELTGPNQAVALERLGTEQGNIRAALGWMLDGGAPGVEDGLRLAAAMCRFWEVRGLLAEGRSWPERLLAALPAAGEGVSVLARARGLYAAGRLAYRQGDLEPAQTLVEQSLALFQELSDRVNVAAALNSLGLISYHHADFDLATTRFEESLALARELEHKRGVALALANLANIAHNRCDYRRAMELTEESLALRREIKDAWGIASALGNLANAVHMQGDYARAIVLGEESLARFRELQDQVGIALCLVNLAGVARDQGEGKRAHELVEESTEIFRRIGDSYGTALSLLTLGDLACDAGDYGTAAVHYHDALTIHREMKDDHLIAVAISSLAHVHCAQDDHRRALDLYGEGARGLQAAGDRRGLAISLEGAAGALARAGQLERAALFFGAAASLREVIGTPISPVDRPMVDRTLEIIGAALGAEGLSKALQAGSSMTAERAIEDLVHDDAASSGAAGPIRLP